MKVLVLAQIPPPLHGQSAMIRLLVEELGQAGQGFELHHVNLPLSRESGDVGRWRIRKLPTLLGVCIYVWLMRWRHGPMALYYVPAPGRRIALYRDWIIMALCRGLFSQLVLHWHAVGLGHWLETHATAVERRITRRLLGHADLSIVLAPELASDVEVLWPERVAIVPNARADTGVLTSPNHRQPGSPFEILFLGTCSREKGLFDVCDALKLLHARTPTLFRLTVAGTFDSPETEREFRARTSGQGSSVRYVGFADDAQKRALLADSDVFCFPTYYRHEGQPLVLIEALAQDVPIITTRWRAIPGMLPKSHVWYVEPQRPDQIADALLDARKTGPAHGVLKEHYLLNFTPAQHLFALKNALRLLEG